MKVHEVSENEWKEMSEKKRILTGDRPTGKLHLGHYVGSIKNRLALQDQFDCYFIIARRPDIYGWICDLLSAPARPLA